MSVRLDALRRQFNDAKSGIDTIEARATSASRDLSDAEQGEVDALYARCADLTPDIEAEGARQERMSAAAGVLARIQPSSQPQTLVRAADAPLPSVGEYMSLILRAKQGDTEAGEMLTRAVATMKLADTPGVIPAPIVGPVIKMADDSRPVFASMTQRPMPNGGKTFSRPRVTQRVLVAEQVAELDELASRKMTIVGSDVSKRTFGGTLEISRQDLDWTDPAVLQIVIDDFAGYYGMVTEGAACVALTALATTVSPWDATGIGTMVSSITNGLLAGYTATMMMLDTLWLSADQMFALAGTTNATTNASALSLIKQALADSGSSVNIVVGPQLPAGTRILGTRKMVEAYENVGGLLSAPDVTHLGVFVSYYGYVAFYGLAAGFVKLGA